MKFFNYCFFRISSAYQFIDSTGYYIFGNGVVSASQSFNVLTILSIFLYAIEEKQKPSYAIVIGVLIFLTNLFLYDKNKYNKLSEQCKDEKHKTLKGWLVFSYVVASLVLFFVSLYI